jgi:hypothetical protein
MSGASIIGNLLREDDGVGTLVADDSIKAGRLPDNAPLPALLIRTISSVEQPMLVRTGYVRMTDRIAVTIRAADYRCKETLRKLVLACCAGVTGDVPGFDNVVIDNAGLGPDLNGPSNTFEQTQDFKVSYDETL